MDEAIDNEYYASIFRESFMSVSEALAAWQFVAAFFRESNARSSGESAFEEQIDRDANP